MHIFIKQLLWQISLIVKAAFISTGNEIVRNSAPVILTKGGIQVIKKSVIKNTDSVGVFIFLFTGTQ